tara:strand:- start:14078 stop:14362 length:285 start_codon:yes stop_codon:yes gene_type:complete
LAIERQALCLFGTFYTAYFCRFVSMHYRHARIEVMIVKSYAELKAEKEANEKQMEQTKKDEHKAMIKQVRELYKIFMITAGQLKDTLAEGSKNQ